MTLDLEDTIAAIASAPGGAVRGILRLTGPDCVNVIRRCFSPRDEIAWEGLRSSQIIAGEITLLGEVKLPADLFLWPTRRSYTRQPSAELHTFGSPPLLELALDAVTRAGARLAGPGEFTLRAFLAGRIDLTQAEAVLGVIDARDEHQLQAALTQLAGGLARPLHDLRNELLDLLAHLEAGLDFVDEDIEFISAAELQRALTAAAERIAHIADQMQSRGEASDIPRVVLWGKPNAGKSSLLNALVGGDAALVSPIAGTTRDYVGRRLELGGRTLELVDTAGVGEACAGDAVSAAAQQMTASATDRGELRLICVDATSAEVIVPPLPDTPAILVWTKCDLPAAREIANVSLPHIRTSATTGSGVEELKSLLLRTLEANAAGGLANTSARCRDSLRLAADALTRARDLVVARGGEELVAAELHVALDELGRVVGAVYTDDILDRIFSRFCIGK